MMKEVKYHTKKNRKDRVWKKSEYVYVKRIAEIVKNDVRLFADFVWRMTV